MATTVFPTSGDDMLEAELLNWIKTLIAQNWVVSGFTVPASDADLVMPVALGEAMIDGARVVIDGATNVTCTDANTNHIYLKLTKSGGLITGAEFEVNITGTPPADSVKICTAVAVAGAITGTTDARVTTPFAVAQVDGAYAQSGEIRALVQGAIAAGTTPLQTPNQASNPVDSVYGFAAVNGLPVFNANATIIALGNKGEVHIPLFEGNSGAGNGASSTSTSYTAVDSSKLSWVAANWSAGYTWYLEAHFGNAGAVTSSLQLYNTTDAAPLVDITTTTKQYVRSSAITMPSSGTKTLDLRYKTSDGGVVVELYQARLIGVPN